MKYLLFGLLAAGSIFGATITPTYATDYSLIDLGAAPSVPTNYGGITFLAGDNNTLIVAGTANNGGGALYTLGVTRDANGHITGFSGPATLFATAPNNDGGLAYAPNGTLLFTEYNNNAIGEIKPGSTSPDATVSLGGSGVPSSVGTLNFVPAGYNGAGNLVVGSYNGGQFCTVSMTNNGDGTYGFGACTNSVTIGGGPEGLIYVPQGSSDFASQSVLVSEYSANKVVAFQIDANGLPIPATGQDFITGLNGAEGAVVDPVTGDFLFSTFGSSNHIYEITGFATPTPEPGTMLLLAAGLAGAGFIRRRKA
ncbi:MAG TPA: PEP-CTERM sorting domain-containing protein [Bryobacteraceae bacterium]|jgi:hypothetical protein